MFKFTLRFGTLATALGLLIATAAGADDKKADDKKDEKNDVKIELKVGDTAPTFQLPDDSAKSWSSSDHFKKKWVVIYFYPGDFTPGCTAQAKAFNASMQKLTAKGVEVVGISGDSVQTHELFKKVHKLEFTLLADPEGNVAKQFGVPFGKGATVKARDAMNKPLLVDGKQHEFMRQGTASLWAFVIGQDGTIGYLNSKVNPVEDAKKISEFIEKSNEKK
jgi:peroxiredoxin Q/BCP